jgi:MFS family permease
MRNVLQYNYLELGLIFGVTSISTAALTILFGILGDRSGRVRALLIASSLLPLSSVILLTSRSFSMVFLANALGSYGIAGGTVGGSTGGYVAPLQNALLAIKSPANRRTTVFSRAMLIGGLSASAGALLNNLEDYRLLFMLGLFITLVSALLFIMVGDEQQRKGREEGVKSQGNKVILKFGVTGALNGVSQGLVTPFFTVLFSSIFRVSNGLIGDVMGLGTLLSSITVLLTPALTKRLGFVNLIGVTRIVSASLFIVFPLAPTFMVAGLVYIVGSVLRMVSLPAQQSLMATLSSARSESTTFAVNQTARTLPSSFATYFSGFSIEYVSIEIPFVVAAFITFANVGFYYAFFKKDQSKISD